MATEKLTIQIPDAFVGGPNESACLDSLAGGTGGCWLGIRSKIWATFDHWPSIGVVADLRLPITYSAQWTIADRSDMTLTRIYREVMGTLNICRERRSVPPCLSVCGFAT